MEPPKEVKDTRTPAEKQADDRAADELRRFNQTEFDPKVHGVGSIPDMAPDSVAKLFKYVQSLESRLLYVENRLRIRS